jgi:hypothetical protein
MPPEKQTHWLTIDVYSAGSAAVKAGLLQTASAPLGGTFRVGFDGVWSAPISARIEDSQQLCEYVTAVRRMGSEAGNSIQLQVWPSLEEVFTSGEGFEIFIQFRQPSGNVPKLEIDRSSMTGADYDFAVIEMEDGNADAVMLEQIPADYFEMPEYDGSAVNWTNIAFKKTVTASSSFWNYHGRSYPSGATDGKHGFGNYHDNICVHTSNDNPAWIKVDLQQSVIVDKVHLIGRTSHGSSGWTIRVGASGTEDDEVCRDGVNAAVSQLAEIRCNKPLSGRFVSVWSYDNYIVLCEIQVPQTIQASLVDQAGRSSVRVVTRGILGASKYTLAPTYAYMPSRTPKLLAVSPTTVQAGTKLSITVANLLLYSNSNKSWLDDIWISLGNTSACIDIALEATLPQHGGAQVLSCTVTAGQAGEHKLILRSTSQGVPDPSSAPDVTYRLTVSSIHGPMDASQNIIGSMAGGVPLTFKGDGLTGLPCDTIQIGGLSCFEPHDIRPSPADVPSEGGLVCLTPVWNKYDECDLENRKTPKPPTSSTCDTVRTKKHCGRHSEHISISGARSV